MPPQRYKRVDLTTAWPLDQTNSGWHSEITVENNTGESIFIMRPDGSIYEVHALYQGQTFGQRVLIKYRYRVGLSTSDLGRYVGQLTENSAKYPTMDIEINFQELIKGPIFVPELGLALALQKDVPRLKEDNYLDPEYFSRKFSETCCQMFTEGWVAPMVIRANSHDPSKEFLYVEINKRICSVKIDHNTSAAEEITFYFNRSQSHVRIKVPDLDWEKCSSYSLVIQNYKWLFGTDPGKLQKLIEERELKLKNMLTPEEVNSRVEMATQDLQKEISELKTVNEQLRRELEIVRKDFTNASMELNRANDSSKATYEQQMLAYKLANTMQEQENLKEKRAISREQAAFAMESERRRADADFKIAESKVAKESLSVRSAEMSNYGTFAKTATVAIPIAASALWWLAKASAASAGLVGLGTVGLVPAAIGGAVVCCARPIVSALKYVGNSICRGVRSLWDKLFG